MCTFNSQNTLSLQLFACTNFSDFENKTFRRTNFSDFQNSYCSLLIENR